jgi:hypothetical protein
MVNGAIGVIGATAASRAGKVSRKESEFVTTRRQVEVYIYNKKFRYFWNIDLLGLIC